MKKALNKLAPGDIFTYAEQRFVVLEHQGDGVFVLTEGKVGDSPFQSKDIDTPNDYSQSTLKEAVEDFVVRLITKGATLDDMVPFELDLRPTDMSTGYGTIMVQAAPLTLWQYGKFKDIIPLLDDWWWLAPLPAHQFHLLRLARDHQWRLQRLLLLLLVWHPPRFET